MKKFFCILAAAFLSLFSSCCAPPSSQPVPDAPSSTGTCTLTFITIGKGDAFLLTSPEEKHFLIDTGKAEDYPQIARTLRVKHIDHLDGIFLSHGHKDHIGGLDTLLAAFPTDTVYYSSRDPVSYTKLLPWEIAERHQTKAVALKGGETLDLGGAAAEIWLPDAIDADNANNNSMMLRLVHGNNACLMTGDAELGEERRMIGSGAELKANILKLGHHGETDATSPEFLDQVQPQIALIAGNAEENPDSVNPTIRGYLEERNITPYYSEGEHLALDFISDGNTILVSPVADQVFPVSLCLALEEVDRKEQRVVIRNLGGSPADLDGCLLLSERGHEFYVFPSGTRLEPNHTIAVACPGHEQPGDLIWPEPDVWRKKKDDALLYDKNMNLLAKSPA